MKRFMSRSLPLGIVFIVVLSLLFPNGASSQTLVINEVMADNQNAVANGSDHPDYVELYNPTGSPVNLANLSLTDNTNTPTKFRFPANTPPLGAGGYLVVWCDTNNAAPGLHTGFSFKNSGELAALYDTNGLVRLDLVAFGLQVPDLSIGRIPDGNGTWQLNRPTTNQPNQAVTLGSPLTLKYNEWLATNSAGTDEDWFELYNPASAPVALEGLVFTDTFPGTPANRAVPALSFITSQGFIQFFADDLDESEDADHVDFRLSSASGEILTLYDINRTTIIDRVAFGSQTRNISQGRLPDGGTNIVFFPTNFVSPAAANKFQPLTNIVINEVITHTDPPLEDAIELHNPTAVSVDVSDWWLSNSDNEPQKFRIPSNTIIPPGGFKVFYEFAGQAGGFNPSGTGDAPSFTLNSARGDEVYLSTGNSTGSLTGFRRSVDFGAAENGVSFGRYFTSTEVDFVAMSQRTFGTDNPSILSQFRTGTGLTNAYPKVGPIVLNELMYHPPDIGTNDNTLDEFIELLNVTGNTVLLYDPLASTNTWKLGNGVDFVFPLNKSLAPSATLLVVNFDPGTNATQLAAFRSKYGVATSIQIFGPYDGKLDNKGESIELYKPDTPQTPPHPDAGFVPYILVDKVKYSDLAPWPTEPDGTGASLQRKNPSEHGNDPVNWKAGSPVTCTYSLSASNALFNSQGGSSNVTVITQSACPWTATNTNNWITITVESSSGSGTGTVNYTVAPNPNTLPRTGRFTIAGKTFTVTQGGPDSIKPTVTISSPAAGARLTNALLTVKGTARDNFAIGAVEYQLGSSPFQTATGTTTWGAQIALAPGTNTVRVRSVDLAGNISATNSRAFFYVVTSPLTVSTNGVGSVSPNLNGRLLEIGRRYLLTATPGAGFVFSNWTGGLLSSTSRLNFLMQSDLMLQANFVPNPFIPVKGVYNGLFYDTSGVLHESSGFFTATVTDRGTFTGNFKSNGKSYALSGQFNLEGQVTRTVPRPGTTALTVGLQLDLANGTDKITGTITDGAWEAELVADRAVFNAKTNASRYLGKYTLVILGSTDGVTSPGGDGFGTANVDAGGNVSFNGSLADGTVAAQRVPLSKDGHWPLYVSLYAGKGSLLSWVAFTDRPSDDLNGRLNWIKPTLPVPKYYLAGFTNDTELIGARYRAPMGTTNRAVQITNGIVAFSGGDLNMAFTNEVRVGANNKVTNASPNKLMLTIVPSTGLFNGTVTPPGTNKIHTFKGALLQKQTNGSGFFLHNTQSGRVFFGPNPP